MDEKEALLRTLEQFNAYLAFEKGLSPNSVEAYDDDVQKLFRYLEGTGKELSTVTEDDLHAFLSDIHDLGIQPRSQARIISGLRRRAASKTIPPNCWNCHA